jgi:hypothetical protein
MQVSAESNRMDLDIFVHIDPVLQHKKKRMPLTSTPYFSISGSTSFRTRSVVATPVVVGFQAEKVTAVSQSKSGNVWIYSTVCTLATVRAHSVNVWI